MINSNEKSKGEESLLWMIHRLVLGDNPKQLAEELGKAYSTFMREVNPDDQDAKLGFMTAITVLKLVEDVTVLDRIEQIFGRVAFKLPRYSPEFGLVVKQTSKAIKEFGEFMEQAAEALDDGRVSEMEAARCEKEGHDVIRAILEFLALIEERGGQEWKLPKEKNNQGTW